MVTMTPVDLLERCAQVVEKPSDGSVVGCRARGFWQKSHARNRFRPCVEDALNHFG
jgi:hypothetical protein